VPALNDLLAPYDIALGDSVLTGHLGSLGPASTKVASGVNILRFPKGGFLHFANLADRSTNNANTASAGQSRIGLGSG
jgi:membrane-bound transcription factor site-1 protease